MDSLWSEFRFYAPFGLAIVVFFVLFATMCSKPQLPDFDEAAGEFCASMQTKVRYVDQERKLVICE